MTTQTAVDSIESLLGESREAVFSREATSLEALVHARNGRVVIFGAGSTGMRALRCIRSIGIEPLAIVDNDARLHGTVVDGLAVSAPAEAALRYGEDSLFIVAIWNAKHWYSETLAQLRTLGCRDVVPVSTVYWRLPKSFCRFIVKTCLTRCSRIARRCFA